ncbi:uncharacterized protein LOC134059298 isoform X2 [Sardina pilchardus]|uniref:uncharacterized protein LOC134059298 isoform X2 n=1 Tax=Sardina pilchardus TaxID=27697 RepID=UPI002E13E622
MVRVCSVPGCETKMKSYNPESFHKLPLRYDRSLVNQWLSVLNMDIETPIETLRLKDYRVCSAHFDKDDFVFPRRASDPTNPKRMHVKKNAIPRVFQLPMDRLEVSGCDPSDVKDPELTAISQSTPKKTPHKDGSKRKGLPATLTLSLSGSEQTALSTTYLARPPTWQLLEDSKMSQICIIQGCNRTEQLLSFPKNPSTRQQWMVLLDGRLKHPVNSSSTMCSAHFPPDCFTNWQQKQAGVAASLTLKPDALPSLFMDANNEDSKMSEICIIQGCNRTEQLLSFPKNPSTQQQWMVLLDGRLKHPVNSSSTMCSAHFPPDCFTNWQQKQAGVAASLTLKPDALPSLFMDANNEVCSLSLGSIGRQCDLQQKMVTVGTGSSKSMPLHAHSKATQTPAVTHVSFGEGLDFLLHPARVVTVQRSHCSVHTTVWASGCEPNNNTSIIPGRNSLISDVVVKIASLLQLFQKCLKCCSDACSVNTRREGPVLHVAQQCWSCGNSREWTSQQPLDPGGSPEAEEEPLVTSPEDMALDTGEEFTIKIVEEDEDEEKIEDEDGEVHKWMEEGEAVDCYELSEHEDEEEKEDMSEEEVMKQKPTKRKRKDSDDEWIPDTEKVTEASDEEFEGSEGEDEEENIQVGWCTLCGEETSARCLKQKHLQLYCCIKCNEELVWTDDQETQHTISPEEAPTSGDQESSCDVSEAAERTSSPETSSYNKQTASSDPLEDSNSISSEGVITSASQHATTSGIQEVTSNGVNVLGSSSSSADTHGFCSIREQGSVGSHDQGGARSEMRWHDPKYAVYFSDADSLQIHVERFHGYKSKRELCPDCGKFIFRRLNRAPHICDHKAKLFLCLTCGKRCVNEAGLRIHSHVHTEEYVLFCQYCYKKFRDRKDKQEHEKTHSGERMKYRCSECPKRFADCTSRSTHRRTHWERGRFFCKVCDKGFSGAHHLKRHEIVHTGLKPYRCEVCDLSFNQLSHLKSHMRVHTGEKPFKCQDCGQCFNHNVSLKNHIQRKHK